MNLYDSSAVFNLYLADRAEPLFRGLTLDLAAYELGNAVRRLVSVEKRLSLDEGVWVMESLEGITGRMVKAPLGRYPDVLRIAEEERLTFYDASYLAAAIWGKLQLVTDDSALRDAARKHVRVLGSGDF